MQVLTDVLRSDGTPGYENESAEQVVKLYVSNTDFHYGASHSLPRITNGAFLDCLSMVFETSTTRRLAMTACGKPHLPVFRYAEELLAKMGHGTADGHHGEMSTPNLAPSPATPHPPPPPLPSQTPLCAGLDTVYMVGDNPKSDIAGALAAGGPWRAVLVRSGCFKDRPEEQDHGAHIVCDDLAAAWQIIREREGL